MAKHFPYMRKPINSQIEEVQGRQSMGNMKNEKPLTAKHILIKLLKTSDKDKITNSARKIKEKIYTMETSEAGNRLAVGNVSQELWQHL